MSRNDRTTPASGLGDLFMPTAGDNRSDTDRVMGHPAIDSELAESVWPALLEQKELGAKLTDEEFVQSVAEDTAFWNPDLSGVEVEETTIPSAGGDEELPVLILRPRGAHGALPCMTTPPTVARFSKAAGRP